MTGMGELSPPPPPPRFPVPSLTILLWPGGGGRSSASNVERVAANRFGGGRPVPTPPLPTVEPPMERDEKPRSNPFVSSTL